MFFGIPKPGTIIEALYRTQANIYPWVSKKSEISSGTKLIVSGWHEDWIVIIDPQGTRLEISYAQLFYNFRIARS